jgi:peptide deformylase
MAILEIIEYPNDILTTPTTNITRDEIKSSEIQTLIEDMTETCLHTGAVGLAANQVGVNKSVIVCRKPGTDKFIILINPVFMQGVGKMNSKEEGCMSLPDQFFNMKRWKKVTVEAYDREAEKKIAATKSKKLAKILQHEMDHLNGILINTGKKVT